ncbi:mRNA splicing protein [Thecaphora frezii]
MSSVGKLSREEFRRQKDLDAARKAGTAAPEVDEDGNIINPHVPEFMAKAPWYLDTGKPSLKHQKKPVKPGEVKAGINDWYQRGQVAGPAATKYRKGACENCGAMTHQRKDCLERPRKKGAKITGKDIRPDEIIQEVKGLDYASKRDRWNGYDPTEHRKVMEEFEAIEAERRRLREEEIDNQTSNDLNAAKKLAKKEKGPKDDGDFASSDEDDEDDEKYAEKADAVGQKIDTDKRITVRNLRIREDRAKYLYNLDPNSAYYDAKTRSMREAPDPSILPEDAEYAGDNFTRGTGQAAELQKLQLFAWQAESRGNRDIHAQAHPTINEMQFREYQQKKEKLREATKGSILERYGGAEHFDSLPRELLTGQSENYVEYNQSGKIIKGVERAKVRSKYEEDVYDQNHTAVWGSWYDINSAQWGYRCCHSTMPNSYCTGEAGIEASKSSMPSSSKAIASGSGAVDKGSGQRSGKKMMSSSPDKGKTRKRSHSVSSSSSRSSYSSYSSASSSESESDSRRHRRRHRSSSSSKKKSSGKRSRRRSRSRSFSTSDSNSDSDSARDLKRDKVRSYQSRKNMGEGDVSSRLDKDKLKEALEKERAKRDPRLARELEERERRKEEAKPDWLKEAEAINSRGKRKAEAEEVDVTEEQLEAYRLVNRDAYEDPMANYRDEDQK